MFKDAVLDIPCPGCGQKNPKRIAELRPKDEIACRSCGRSIEIEAEKLLAGIEKADKTLTDFRRKLRRIGKRR